MPYQLIGLTCAVEVAKVYVNPRGGPNKNIAAATCHISSVREFIFKKLTYIMKLHIFFII